MKKHVLILVFVLMGSPGIIGQISKGGSPPSFLLAELKQTRELPSRTLQKLDIESLLDEDSRAMPFPERYSIFEKVHLDIKSVGFHETLKDLGGEIWRYRLNAPEAKSIQLVFEKFSVPDGSRLFVYDESRAIIYGAFTSDNMTDDLSFIVADFPSDHLILEYFEPLEKDREGVLVLGSVGKAYINIFKNSEDEDGYIGINCIEAKDFQEEKHAVCRITFRIGNTGFLCTGSLMNNVRNDGTPYFLTANHCISDSATAKTMVAFFNYENKTCNGQVPMNYKSLSGASMLSTGSKSDYTLLLLDDLPPPEYMPYYAGWDLAEETGNNSATIHHAEGGVKRIALDIAPPVSYDQVLYWGATSSTPANSHWLVQFDLGRTASGSSGAPLFSEDRKVIGQLHGGDDVLDFYGKLNYSWTAGSPGNPAINTFLDPDNTDTVSLNGFFPQSNLPEAQFFTDFKEVCQGAPVDLINSSAFSTHAWEWTIEPGSVTYLEGTDSLSREPVVSFDSPGSYSIRLSSENSAGTASITKTEYISAGENLTLDLTPLNHTDSCLCSFDSLSILAGGAAFYIWDLSDASDYNFVLDDTTGNLATIKGIEDVLNDTISGLSLRVRGSHGSCADTLFLSLPLISQPNDNIENPIPLSIGRNGPFTNQCATVQDFEPVPPHFSCTSQMSWCDEVGVDIVANSVWFSFTGPASGLISLKSFGFDNEIAIYEADSYQDILNGKYTLISANDDRSFTDYNAIIYGATVIEGKTYWVQVDGSGGNSEGSFYLDLDDEEIVSSLKEAEAEEMRIYPLPATDHVVMEIPDMSRAHTVSAEVMSVAGRLIWSHQWQGLPEDRIRLETTGWESGVYVVRIILNGERVYHGRIVK